MSWINEGVSDWAQSLTGYVDPTIDPAADDADGHMACFAGYLGEDFGGPENSLTQWNEQGAPETLCDYGATYTFMEYLHSHWGDPIMTKLHRLDANGLKGLDKALDAVGAKPSAMQVLHRWQSTVAVDKRLDQNGGDLEGGQRGSVHRPQPPVPHQLAHARGVRRPRGAGQRRRLRPPARRQRPARGRRRHVHRLPGRADSARRAGRVDGRRHAARRDDRGRRLLHTAGGRDGRPRSLLRL